MFSKSIKKVSLMNNFNTKRHGRKMGHVGGCRRTARKGEGVCSHNVIYTYV